jgi:stress-induced-phosphoprotein 1
LVTCRKAIEVGRANRADYSLIAKAYVRIGNAHLKKGETKENLEAAINMYEAAQVENRTKDVEKKIKTLQVKARKARELAYIDPEKALAAKNEGNEFFKAGDFPQAVERYSEAIKRDPSNAIYYANRAAAYTKLTSFVDAKKDCEKALDLDPNYVKAYSRMGAIQMFMKEFHKARESYEKGLKIDPNNQECQDGLRNVMYKIQSGDTDEERAAHGLADPEIQAILRDPVMQNVLNDFQTDPMGAQRHLQNPGIMAKIEKLIAAGVLQTK